MAILDIIRKSAEILAAKGFWDYAKSINSVFVLVNVKSIERVAVFCQGVLPESRPGDSVELIEQWYKDLDIFFEPDESIEIKQSRAAAIYTSIGGQNPSYLRAQIQKEFPLVDFEERTGEYPDPEGLYFRFFGTLATEADIPKFFTLVSKLFPLHLEYQDLTETEDLITSAVCNAGRCGVARCGRNIGDPL